MKNKIFAALLYSIAFGAPALADDYKLIDSQGSDDIYVYECDGGM